MGDMILKRNEAILLQEKYLPELYSEYKEVVKLVSLIVEKTTEIDNEKIYLSDSDQRKLLKKVRITTKSMEKSLSDLNKHIKDILKRLDMPDEE